MMDDLTDTHKLAPPLRMIEDNRWEIHRRGAIRRRVITLVVTLGLVGVAAVIQSFWPVPVGAGLFWLWVKLSEGGKDRGN